tara:strand:- start:83 stop:823 length:741 start_codon:yes stop_codon:yes gene_type:complete
MEGFETLTKSDHYCSLNAAYNAVGKKTWVSNDFVLTSLDTSRSLFTGPSLEAREPVPKHLEVYALLSGVSFERGFSSELVKVQKEIDEVLDGSLRYWVLEENLGLEYCVFKWPDGTWDRDRESQVFSDLPVLENSFQFVILGIQINPDGCIVAKGFDEGAAMFKFRQKIKDNIDFLPVRQSAWAHVPLGRILEPLGEEKFSKLATLCKGLSDIYIASCEIKSTKFVHETQWYMEEKKILKEFYATA